LSLSQGHNATYSIVSANPDNIVLSSAGVFTFIQNQYVPSQTVIVRATNAFGSGTDMTFTLLADAKAIAAAPTGPQSIDTTSATDTTVQLSLTQGHNATSYSIVGTPPTGVSINNAGVLRFNFTQYQLISTTTVTVRATNAFGNGTPDMTFSLNASYQGFFSKMTSGAKASLTGAYSLVPLLARTAKVLNITRNSPSATTDVFVDMFKNFTVTDGSSLSTWIGSSTTVSITKWYDQSGKSAGLTLARDAIWSSGNGTQPVLDAVNNCVDASAGAGFFTMAPETIPGGSSFTFVAKHGPSASSVGGICGGGPPPNSNPGNKVNNLRIAQVETNFGYQNYWWANDYNFYLNGVNTVTQGAVVTCKYTGDTGTTYGYINGTASTSSPSPRSGWNYTPWEYAVLCKTTGDQALQGKMYACFMFSSALSDIDRGIAETVTAANYP
jgi:hypothetical protein